MRRNKIWAAMVNVLAATTVVLAVTLLLAAGAWGATTYKVLHQFKGQSNDGIIPYGGVIFDSAGRLYGTTKWGYGGGCDSQGCGAAFQLTPNSDGTWTESILYGFSDWGPPGTWPLSGLVFDGADNLYGTTPYGGSQSCGENGSGCGVVFELASNLDGTWTESTLYSFTGGSDGAYPNANVIFDISGNLYGTTPGGGAYGYGAAFILTPNSGGTWTEKVLHQFKGAKDGASPYGSLVFDQSGNLYGTTSAGGVYGKGNVYELIPQANGSWTEKVLHQFKGGNDGANPYAHVVFDASGNLYGTTWAGGAHGEGNVFKLIPNSNGSWTEKVLYQFKGGNDGANPYAGTVFDSTGSLYGTTARGGPANIGTVFNLVPDSNGKWRERVLHRFQTLYASEPYDDLILDGTGNIYGTAAGANCRRNNSSCGVVFEITP
jgi:uncharacterized repeat protein (TIGR03803 family)